MSSAIEVGASLQGSSGEYVIDAEHARGGFGVTWRGRRASDDLPVIIKVLRFDRMKEWKALELFEREARVLRTLRHPGIPAHVDDFVIGGPAAPDAFVLVQELVPGTDLRRGMLESVRLDEDRMLSWLDELLAVLEYLHGLSPPVIHRDVTPKNVVLRPDGHVALVDFGAVQAVLRDASTVSSTAAGTFGYAPMEQFVGRASPASDLYGLAMTYLAVASGLEPSQMPLEGMRVDVRALVRGNPRLVSLLESMAEPDPRRRLSSASLARQRLERIRSGDPSTEEPRSEDRQLATQIRDFDGYVELVSGRLRSEGFSVMRGGSIAATPLALVATRGAGGRSSSSILVYVARAEDLESSAGPRAEALARFVRAVIEANAERTRGSAFLRGRTWIVPVVVFRGDPGADVAAALRRGAALVGRGVQVPVLVDLEAGAARVLRDREDAGGDPERTLPYVWWLAAPRIVDRPRVSPRGPIWRIAMTLALGVAVMLGAGVAVWLATADEDSFLVWTADPVSRRIAVSHFGPRGFFAGSELTVVDDSGRVTSTRSFPAGAYLCGATRDAVTYYTQDEETRQRVYWREPLDGGEATELARAPRSFWYWCALSGPRIAAADGSASRPGRVWVLNQDAGSSLARGTAEGDRDPAWFPDGRHLVVANGERGRERLVEIDLASGRRTELTSARGEVAHGDIHPSVSPDGLRVAFYRVSRHAYDRSARSHTSEVMDLTVATIGRPDDARLLIQEVCWTTPPAWLSNTEIVYAKWEGSGEGCGVYLFDLGSEATTRLLAPE